MSSNMKQVFEFLDATHATLGQHLHTLMGMAKPLQDGSLSPAQVSQLKSLCKFFDKEARQHHRSEEHTSELQSH